MQGLATCRRDSSRRHFVWAGQHFLTPSSVFPHTYSQSSRGPYPPLLGQRNAFYQAEWIQTHFPVAADVFWSQLATLLRFSLLLVNAGFGFAVGPFLSWSRHCRGFPMFYSVITVTCRSGSHYFGATVNGFLCGIHEPMQFRVLRFVDRGGLCVANPGGRIFFVGDRGFSLLGGIWFLGLVG